MNRRDFALTAGRGLVGAAATVGLGSRTVFATNPPQISVAAVGDIIISRKVSVVQDERVLSLMKILRDAHCTYANCEINFLDPRTAHPTPKGSDMNLVCDPWGADELAWMGFNLVGRANNHALDYGPEGLEATLANLDRAGIVHAGDGMSLGDAARPAYVETPGGRVALVNFASTFPAWSLASHARPDSNGRPGLNPARVQRTYQLTKAEFDRLTSVREALFPPSSRPTPGMPPPNPTDPSVTFLGNRFAPGASTDVFSVVLEDDVKRITEAIRLARSRARLVLATIHAHEAYRNQRDVPDSFLQPLARACIDAGADAFIGAGPHLLRGIELYKRKPIFYSLGNFFFQHQTVKQIPAEVYESVGLPHDATDPSLVYDKRLAFDDRVYWESVVPVFTYSGDGLSTITLHPVVLNKESAPHDRGMPMLASAEDRRKIVGDVTRLSEPFGTRVSFNEGDGTGVVDVAGGATQ